MLDFIKRGFFLLLIILPLTACSENYTYEGKAIKGRVLDAASGEPLQGAVVVALWAKRGGLHTDTIGYVHLDEAVTDSAGRYELKAWGPVEVSGAYMGSFSPDLILFKQGYKYQRVNEGFLPPAKDKRVWTSKWDGQVMELETFEGDIYEYKKHLRFLNTKISDLRRGEECEWKKVPRLMIEIHNSEINIKQKISGESLPKNITVDMNNFYTIDQLRNQPECGSAFKFFKEYLHDK